MSHIRLAWVWAGAAAGAVLSGSAGAHAGAFALRDQSAYGQGASYAGIAAGGSLSALFWNPATLSQVRGIEIELVGTGIFPDADVHIDAQPELGTAGSAAGNIGEDAFVPAGYAAIRLNDTFTVGAGLNVPFGLETRYDGDSIINQSGVAGRSRVASANFNPAISVDLTEWLAVAVGAQLQYFDARLTQQALGPLGVSSLDGDDYSIGFTAGLRLTPLAGTEIGLGYRSGISHDLDGTLQTATAGTFDVHYEGVDLPDIVTLGVRQRITERLRLMGGVEWQNWSRFDTVQVKDGPAPIDLKFDYDDAWFFSGGAELDLTSHASIRAGIGYEISPVDDAVRTFRLPYGNGLRLSVGTSYRLNHRLAIDLGYSFVAVEDTDIRAADQGGPESNGPFSGSAETIAHYVSAAIKLRFGDH
jgi:long-chain fatty acid transport protein